MLDVQDLSISWNGNPVVHDVSFQLRMGEVLAIVGASGSGKSTLLHAILGLPSDTRTVTGGRILLDGRDLLRLSADERRGLAGSTLSMIFQDAGASFCPVRRIGDELLDSVRGKGWTREDLQAHARPLLQKLRLDADVLDAYPFELSGGMAARVGILAALLLSPRVLLADEPTSALDPISTSKIEELAMELKNKYTIITVTHNMQQAVRISDNTAFFLLGDLIEYGNTEKLFEAPSKKKTEDYITGRFG